jgi:hypothetical protein
MKKIRMASAKQRKTGRMLQCETRKRAAAEVLESELATGQEGT